MARLRWLLPALLLVLLFAETGISEKLSSKQISELGKRSTALVEIGGQRKSSGSAFCVDETGLFLTNAHVVKDVGKGKTVRLVVEPGEKAQQILTAEVVMRNEESDLALLKIREKAKIPAFELGVSSELFETMPVYAFGFPFGRILSFEESKFPAISVNSGRITSLRKKDGELELVQIDAELNPGNSGGPVLNESGQVIGIVQSGLRGTGVNFAIPVDKAREFLSQIFIFFETPQVSAKDAAKPVKMEVTAVDFLKKSNEIITVELTLEPYGRPKTSYKMKGDGKTFRVEAPLIPQQKEPERLRARAVYKDGDLRGFLTATTFQVKIKDEKKEEDGNAKEKTIEIPLAEVAEIKGGKKPQIILRKDRESHEIDPGTKIVLNAGPHKIELDLTKVESISVSPPTGPPANVSYVIIARRGKEEVARSEGTIGIRGRSTASTVNGESVSIGRVEFEGDKLVKKCPEALSDIVDGGGGRYLICHFPKIRKLGIFDVEKLEFVKHLSVNDANVKFAAGRDKLIVALPTSGVMQRWDLKTFEKEVTVAIPFTGRLTAMSMGSNSDGPLLVCTEGRIPESESGWALMDIAKMKLIKMKIPVSGQRQVRASADGTVFGYYGSAGSLVIEGGTAHSYRANGSGGLPGPKGRYVYATGYVYTKDLRPLRQSQNERFIPARHGEYYLGITNTSGGNKTAQVRLYIAPGDRQLVTLAGLDITSEYFRISNDFTLDKRIWCLPMAKLLITIPNTNDRFVIHKFDPEEALEKSGIDYLFVHSQPPVTAAAGDVFFYQIMVKSKKGGVTFKLEGAPEEMAISSDGLVTWTIPRDIEEEKTFIIVNISDAAGQEVYHNFEIKIIKP